MSRKLTSLVLHSDCRVICLSHNHLCARYLNTPIFSFDVISDEPGSEVQSSNAPAVCARVGYARRATESKAEGLGTSSKSEVAGDIALVSESLDGSCDVMTRVPGSCCVVDKFGGESNDSASIEIVRRLKKTGIGLSSGVSLDDPRV